MGATLCLCERAADGTVVVMDPHCPALVQHVLAGD